MKAWILGAMLSFVLVPTAHAIRCKAWVGLGEQEREQTLRTSFREILESAGAAKYTSINKTRIERCLIDSVPRIEDDFDDACSRGMAAPMNVLDGILMNYVRSCVN